MDEVGFDSPSGVMGSRPSVDPAIAQAMLATVHQAADDFPSAWAAHLFKSFRALIFGLLVLVVSGAIFFPCIAALLK